MMMGNSFSGHMATGLTCIYNEHPSSPNVCVCVYIRQKENKTMEWYIYIISLSLRQCNFLFQVIMLINGQPFSLHRTLRQLKTLARICRQLPSAPRIPPCTISARYIHMAIPVPLFLLSRYTLSRGKFRTLHGGCFRHV